MKWDEEEIDIDHTGCRFASASPFVSVVRMNPTFSYQFAAIFWESLVFKYRITSLLKVVIEIVSSFSTFFFRAINDKLCLL